MKNKDPDYGLYTFEIRSEVLIHSSYGQWNAESTLNYHNLMIRYVDSICHQPWGIIADLRQWELCPPDCWEILDETMKYCVQHGLCCHATLPNNRVIEVLVDRLKDRSPIPVPHQNFNNTSDALNWCSQLIKDAEHPKGDTI
ncbi:hypothetical protein L4C34_02690 [Vibrio profundum]|uniref:hypothetical protein n=1 Tax=Vibrio profundum TaxID=2910247 RepID=UPI003D14CB50